MVLMLQSKDEDDQSVSDQVHFTTPIYFYHGIGVDHCAQAVCLQCFKSNFIAASQQTDNLRTCFARLSYVFDTLEHVLVVCPRQALMSSPDFVLYSEIWLHDWC